MPGGFHETLDPAPWVDADPEAVLHRAGPPERDLAWSPGDPLERRPGIEADRLGPGFHPMDVGDETGDAASPRPDANVAEEIGAEAGVTFQDAEPIGVTEKIADRDRRRWELDPASSEDYESRAQDEAGESETSEETGGEARVPARSRRGRGRSV
ncbi:MAG TPA: DUF6335 family protein [Thermoanaerobaculia bacterium]